jgi:aryl-alcohol dehydrogenase-like predicted oxidoreductase
MQYLKNQGNGLNISRLGLGCMRMSMLDGTESRKESIATIQAALDAGINFLNTGDFYGTGHNEMLVGEAIKGYSRDKVFISVKFGGLIAPNGMPYGIDMRPLTVKNYLTYSLKRLGVDYVDLYQPCRIDPEIPVEETIEPIAQMVKAGYVKHIGLSMVDAETLRRAHSVHPISLVEVEYSLFNRNIEKELMPTARELGIGIVAVGVLSHGLLSKERLQEMRNRFPQFYGDNLDKNLSRLNALGEIAEEKQITLPQLLSAWVLSQGEDILPLVGARKVSQLEESMKALDVSLSKSDLEKIDDVAPANMASDSNITIKFKNGLMVYDN